ncbi:MAG TPA: rhomboid family intramembrane serine protease [Fluviicola sp.]|nr:rhomboid family intramembrane serine protease [Fluviicola sp.]
MFSILNNIPPVTRNLLILNILMFVLTFFFQTQNIDLGQMLGAHYVNSPLFEPYQIVSHFFMHADILHILFNMMGVVMLGGFLERLWGPKRYFIFYICCALGAFALYNAIGVSEIAELRSQLLSKGVDVAQLESLMKNGQYYTYLDPEINEIAQQYISKCYIPMVGASGAVFGILVAFAILFPNTEFLLYFAIPVKAKYLALGYVAYELYSAYYQSEGDHVAHLAHIGGAIVGTVFVLIWRRNRTHFY